MESTLRAGAGQPGLTLIETLGWTGADFPRLPLHLARLARSAAVLGWSCDSSAVETALRSAVRDVPLRVRLTLEHAGRVQVSTTPMPPTPPLWRLGLATVRLRSDDPWLAIKSSNRGAYDSARAALPDSVDEVLFLNERGEVCDGSITTLFFDRGNGLRTPPVACGLLPGVLRADLLEQGTCHEEVLAFQDLPDVRLWVGNSLRGLIAADWRG